MAKVHVVYNGESWDMDLNDLDLGDLSEDSDIRTAVAESLNVPATKLASFPIERNEETGDITLRPSAVFGK